MLPAGFLEVSHTADRSLRVWAPTMDELFSQAARGMYQLMGTCQKTQDNITAISAFLLEIKKDC